MALDCQIVADDTALNQLLPEWESLWRRVGEPMFGQPLWVHGWWSCIGRAEGDRLSIAAVRSDGRLVAVLPWCIRRRHAIVRVLEWCGCEVADYHGLLVDPAQDAGAALGLAKATVWRAGGFDFARLRQVPQESAFCAWALTSMGPPRAVEQVSQFESSQTAEEFLAGLSKKQRQDYRHGLKHIAEARGAATFHLAETEDEARLALERLFALKRQWAERKGMPDNLITSERGQAFFTTVVLGLLREKRAVIGCIRCQDGSMVSVRVLLKEGKTVMTYLSGYDVDMADASPGFVSLVEAIAWSLRQGYQRVDFLRGFYEYKKRLATGSRSLATFVTGRSLLGHAALAAGQWRARRAAGS